MRTKLVSVQALLWLALVLALAGSLRHVAYTFSSIDGNLFWGWLQAIAIDIGLVGLAIAIQMRRRVKVGSVKFLLLGLAVFTLISVYSNLTYGLEFTLDTLPGWLTVSKPYILAATLPLLVLYLAEIVGSDLQNAIKEREKEQRKAEKQAEPVSKSGPVVNQTVKHPVKAHTVNTDSQAKSERQSQIVKLLHEQPDLTRVQLARQTGVSRTTLYTDLQELEQAGRLNGKVTSVKL